MEKHLSVNEAWDTFWPWIKNQPQWGKMKRREHQYIYKAVKAKRDGVLGPARIKSLLTKYAPERYKFEERVLLIEP